MTSESGKTDSALHRCAVCKIDLKGRLVYIDDQVENLLGFTREDLFGKMFLDFLDEHSSNVVDNLIEKRNNYETFYESTRLGILAREGHIVPSTAVVSLSFIAGNPVNFVFIIIPDDEIKAESGRNNDDQAFVELLENVLAGHENFDANMFLRQLKAVAGATTACLYLVHENSLELRHVAGDNDLPIVATSVPEVSTMHHQVVETGAVYDFTNTDTYEAIGVEADDAPHEYAARMEINGHGCYLVRLIFESTLTEFDVAGGVSRCDSVLRFFGRPVESPEPQQDRSSEVDIRIAVGLLDGLGLGALVTDREGNVIGHNPILYQMVQENDIIGDFRRFSEFLEGVTPDHCESPIRECFLNASDPACCNRLQISLPDGTPAILTVLRLGDGLEDLTSLVAVMPQEATVGRVRVS
ncbi:MAG: PAS domain S-box protein [candidate division Zixibacteria bacterium]|nr:PAS domain S-box protein [candidate division Zixibacteria bacterium]